MEACELDNGFLRQVIANKPPGFVAQALNTSEACIHACIGGADEEAEAPAPEDRDAVFFRTWILLVVIFMLFRMRESVQRIQTYVSQTRSKKSKKRS